MFWNFSKKRFLPHCGLVGELEQQLHHTLLSKFLCMTFIFCFFLLSYFYTMVAVFCLSGQKCLNQDFCGVSLMFEWVITNHLTIFLLIEMTLSYLSVTVCCSATE